MQFAKTKILATLGPATDTIEKLESLIDAGIDAVRLNFSHGNHEYFEKLFKTIHQVCVKKSIPIATLIDLQGPKIRIGELYENEIEIQSGNTIEISTKAVTGSKDIISTSYKHLVKDASPGDKILINDGLIHLQVKNKKTDSLVCKIIEGGILKPRKGMNLPGMKLSTRAVTKKDLDNLEFALQHRVDYIALSFVRSEKDILFLRKWLGSKGFNKPIIAKIEKPEAVENFEKILDAADGIMIARGDLGVELNPQDVPVIQKNIIRRCNSVGKLVITATQMLESMIENPVPTRAEASDVANAVWDGTEVVMLSGETSVGKYPVQAVKTMNEIILKSEAQSHIQCKIDHEIPRLLADNLFDSTGKANKDIADRINAAVIVVFTHYGRKARVIAKFRPTAPIIAISDKFETLNELNLHWGIRSFYVENFSDEENAIRIATDIIRKNSLAKKGDIVLLTSGAPIIDTARKSWVRFLIFK